MEYYKNLDLKDIIYFCEFENTEKVEEWRDIPMFLGIYQASNLGRIKILKRNINSEFYKNRFTCEKIKKQSLSKQDYLCVSTTDLDKKKSTFNVHVLVGMAFLGHIPCGYNSVIDHKNTSFRYVNRPYNLQIISQRENSSKDKKNKTSIYTGVFKRKNRDSWVSSIRINKDKIIIGYFKKEIDAHKAYCIALKNIEKYNGNKNNFRNLIKKIL